MLMVTFLVHCSIQFNFIPCNQSRFWTSASLPANTELTFVPYFTPQQPTVVFQFVKVDDGKCQLIDLLNEDPDGI